VRAERGIPASGLEPSAAAAPPAAEGSSPGATYNVILIERPRRAIKASASSPISYSLQ